MIRDKDRKVKREKWGISLASLVVDGPSKIFLIGTDNYKESKK